MVLARRRLVAAAISRSSAAPAQAQRLGLPLFRRPGRRFLLAFATPAAAGIVLLTHGAPCARDANTLLPATSAAHVRRRRFRWRVLVPSVPASAYAHGDGALAGVRAAAMNAIPRSASATAPRLQFWIAPEARWLNHAATALRAALRHTGDAARPLRGRRPLRHFHFRHHESLDRVIHESVVPLRSDTRSRSRPRRSFNDLKSPAHTDGNLSVHARRSRGRLPLALKSFRRPRAAHRVPPHHGGQARALQGYLDHMEALIGRRAR